MKKRLFLALPITPGLKPKIAHLEREIEKAKFGFQIPWIPLENLHLTILFLDWQTEENIFKIIQVLENYPFGIKELSSAINCIVEKVDYGPPGGNRMIWLYLKKNEKLTKMHQIFKEVLRNAQIPFKEEQRDFLPHINLARLKIKKSAKLPKIKNDLNWGIQFNKLVLFQSILQKPFAQYLPLKEIKLMPES